MEWQHGYARPCPSGLLTTGASTGRRGAFIHAPLASSSSDLRRLQLLRFIQKASYTYAYGTMPIVTALRTCVAYVLPGPGDPHACTPYTIRLFTVIQRMITISLLVFTRCVLLGAWGRGGRGAGAGRGRWALGAGPAETGERALPNFAFDQP